MKTGKKSAESIKNLKQLVYKLSENEILNIQSMSHIRGGNADGEGDGGSSVITRPKF